MEIKVPYLAEGVDSGTVVSILVSVGDTVKKDQTVVELETNKATAPIPSLEAGVVVKIHVKEGQEVAVGQTLMSLNEKEKVHGKAPIPAETKREEKPKVPLASVALSKTSTPPPLTKQ